MLGFRKSQAPLEPENGDFTAYIKKLETGKAAELKGLHIDPESQAQDGMITVRTSEQVQERINAENARRTQSLNAAAPVILGVFGAMVMCCSLALFAMGIVDEEIADECIPLAMGGMFIGIVLMSQSAAFARRMKRENAGKVGTNSTNGNSSNTGFHR